MLSHARVPSPILLFAELEPSVLAFHMFAALFPVLLLPLRLLCVPRTKSDSRHGNLAHPVYTIKTCFLFPLGPFIL